MDTVTGPKTSAALNLGMASANFLARTVFSHAWAAVILSWLCLIWSLQWLYSALDRFCKVYDIDASKYVPKRISQKDSGASNDDQAATGTGAHHMISAGTWGQEEEAEPAEPWYKWSSIKGKFTRKSDDTSNNETVWDSTVDIEAGRRADLLAPDDALRKPANVWR